VSYNYSSSNNCRYGPLTGVREKRWLKAASSTHGALMEIVTLGGK
jgi:hypothetical protein